MPKSKKSPVAWRPQSLNKFVSVSFAGILTFVSLGSGLLQFRDVLNWSTILVIGLIVLAAGGWLAALYVAYSTKFVVSSVEALLESITDTIKVPFVDSWLRGTLLSQRAVSAYWNTESSLSIKEIYCSSHITSRDVKNQIKFAGRSESREDVDGCPMLFIGGSVLHFDEFAGSSSTLGGGGPQQHLKLEGILDLGTLQMARMVFPTMLRRHESFEVEHHHEWPGAMTPGTDIMWYPYAALFSNDADKLVIEVEFSSSAKYIRGYVASLKSGRCSLSSTQPRAVSTSNDKFLWELNDVNNQEIYALVFER